MVLLANAQDPYQSFRKGWLEKAELAKPLLKYKEVKPKSLVEILDDPAAYQGFKSQKLMSIEAFFHTPLKEIEEEIIVDFGDHMVGEFQFVISSTIAAHAPVQLKFTFGEVPSEMAMPFGEYEGRLSSAWLQEEWMTLHYMPDTVRLPRRYAFRYVKIEVLGSAENMDFMIDDMLCLNQSSAGEDKLKSLEGDDELLESIEEVSIKTLRDCMQTVFEDGPKRDQRIWIGDFKLQALANYYSFRNSDLVKRGLYLYAGTASANGLVYGTLFEKPTPHPEVHFPIDYCLLFNTVLVDYYFATKDLETTLDLWVILKEQIKVVEPYITSKGLFEPSDDWWYFVDWNKSLSKETSLQGILIYSLQETWKLAQELNKEAEVAQLPQLIKQLKAGAKKQLFSKESGLFVSGETNQISTASQTWMILSNTVSAKEGRKLFQQLSKQDSITKPVSPYMFHYVVEAMIQCGMTDEALQLLTDYWGGMVEKGADTFWEVYDPEDEHLSPYGSPIMNSYCHAWSCTPVYFIRKYGDKLLK